MAWVTDRDQAMMQWFDTVRLTNMEGLRWALAGMNGASSPVSLRAAQMWCARMEGLGLIDRQRVAGAGGSLVWATHAAIGRPAPQLLSQTARHEVAVSVVSAHYLAAGYEWHRDVFFDEAGEAKTGRPRASEDHPADGVAVQGSTRHLVEVELTSKRTTRYMTIFRKLRRRFERSEMTRVAYFTTREVATTVLNNLEQFGQTGEAGNRAVRQRIAVEPVFGRRGLWETSEQPRWLRRLEAAPAPEPAVSMPAQLDGIGGVA
ncbi:hypothetical protein ACFOYW_17050 [Gryllotalpicola reticulitermitis]|uniref:Transcriptional regulator, AbiEi antitoxin, Type IV TA system n=1 Tax=Gryllotalpicola reticulitermitis TaxID=1184153 RepID=A0ABV8QCK6_9MICO